MLVTRFFFVLSGAFLVLPVAAQAPLTPFELTTYLPDRFPGFKLAATTELGSFDAVPGESGASTVASQTYRAIESEDEVRIALHDRIADPERLAEIREHLACGQQPECRTGHTTRALDGHPFAMRASTWGGGSIVEVEGIVGGRFEVSLRADARIENPDALLLKAFMHPRIAWLRENGPSLDPLADARLAEDDAYTDSTTLAPFVPPKSETFQRVGKPHLRPTSWYKEPAPPDLAQRIEDASEQVTWVFVYDRRGERVPTYDALFDTFITAEDGAPGFLGPIDGEAWDGALWADDTGAHAWLGVGGLFLVHLRADGAGPFYAERLAEIADELPLTRLADWGLRNPVE